MRTERLKVGMIGCGGLPNGCLMPSMMLIDEIELVAVCDLREEASAAAAEKFSIRTKWREYHKSIWEIRVEIGSR